MAHSNQITVNQYPEITLTPDGPLEDPDPENSVTLSGIKNISISKNTEYPAHDNWNKILYTHPDVTVELLSGETKQISSGRIESHAEIEPMVDITLIKDTTASEEEHVLETYSAYGIWEVSYIHDVFEDERSYVVMRIPNRDGDGVVDYSPMYRGIIAKFPDGEKRQYGSFERHSTTYKNTYDQTSPYDPPVASESGVFTVITPDDIIRDAVCVKRNEDMSFSIYTDQGSIVASEEITYAHGSLYTACIKHNSSIGPEEYTITSLKRLLGVYEDDDHYCFVGYPDNAGVYKSPYKKSIEKSQVYGMHIKLPDGTISETVPQTHTVCTQTP
jgi:hypothetical protein